jgi:Flp pilus assembly protein TadB
MLTYLGLAIFAAALFMLVFWSLERSLMERLLHPQGLSTTEAWAKVTALPLRTASARTRANLDFLNWKARDYLSLFGILTVMGWMITAMGFYVAGSSLGLSFGVLGGVLFAVLMAPVMTSAAVTGRRRRIRAAFPDWLSMLYLRLAMGDVPKNIIHDSIEYADPPLNREVARLDSDLSTSIEFQTPIQGFARRLGTEEAQDLASYLQAGWRDRLPPEALRDMASLLQEMAREQAEMDAMKAKITGTAMFAVTLMVAILPALYPAVVFMINQISSFRL